MFGFLLGDTFLGGQFLLETSFRCCIGRCWLPWRPRGGRETKKHRVSTSKYESYIVHVIPNRRKMLPKIVIVSKAFNKHLYDKDSKIWSLQWPPDAEMTNSHEDSFAFGRRWRTLGIRSSFDRGMAWHELHELHVFSSRRSEDPIVLMVFCLSGQACCSLRCPSQDMDWGLIEGWWFAYVCIGLVGRLVSFLNLMLFGLILFDIVIFEGFAISLDRSIGKRSGAGRGFFSFWDLKDPVSRPETTAWQALELEKLGFSQEHLQLVGAQLSWE